MSTLSLIVHAHNIAEGRRFWPAVMTAVTLALGICALALMAGCGGGGGSGGSSGTASNMPTVVAHPYVGPSDRGPDLSSLSAPGAPQRTVTSAADSGSGTLREALGAATDGDTIAISPSLNGQTLNLASTLDIVDDVTITAAGTTGFTIDGHHQRRLVNIPRETTVAITGIRFRRGAITNGDNAAGGAIKAGDHGSLLLRHCTFDDNRADQGGAVRAGYGTELTVEDCAFTNNDGSGTANGFSAGALATNGHAELIVRRSLFTDNRGHTGGAIYNLLQPIIIEDCTFLRNASTGGGGAVFTDEGNWVGPGATTGGTISVRRCWIQDNRSIEVGGGLFLWANPKDVVTVEDCVLISNIVDRDSHGSAKGGGLRTLGKATIRRCAFIDNISHQQGGGLWIDGQGPITVTDSTFGGNQVTKDAGGGITFNHTDSATVLVNQCTFVDNFAQRACGAFWLPRSANKLTLRNSIVANNLAGSDHAQNQIGYAPQFDGAGNCEFPAPVHSGRRASSSGTLADPLFLDRDLAGDMIVYPVGPTSPIIGLADIPTASTLDSRGYTRDGDPDSGALEMPPSGVW